MQDYSISPGILLQALSWHQEKDPDYEGMKTDAFLESPQSRHPGGSQGPGWIVFAGFRLPPE
jgi:hypothetical protein